MSVRIAVGSSDGIFIDQHFGRVNKFYIFELLEDGSSQIIETRENLQEDNEVEIEDSTCLRNGCGGGGSGCNSGHKYDSNLLRKVSLLVDCDAVLVNKIGGAAEKLFLKNNISTFEANSSIEKAFSKLFVYYKRTKKL